MFFCTLASGPTKTTIVPARSGRHPLALACLFLSSLAFEQQTGDRTALPLVPACSLLALACSRKTHKEFNSAPVCACLFLACPCLLSNSTRCNALLFRLRLFAYSLLAFKQDTGEALSRCACLLTPFLACFRTTHRGVHCTPACACLFLACPWMLSNSTQESQQHARLCWFLSYLPLLSFEQHAVQRTALPPVFSLLVFKQRTGQCITLFSCACSTQGSALHYPVCCSIASKGKQARRAETQCKGQPASSFQALRDGTKLFAHRSQGYKKPKKPSPRNYCHSAWQ